MQGHCFPVKVQRNTTSYLPTDAHPKGGMTTGLGTGNWEAPNTFTGMTYTLLHPKAPPRQPQIMPHV